MKSFTWLEITTQWKANLPLPDQGKVGISIDCAMMEDATLSPNAHIECEVGPTKIKF